MIVDQEKLFNNKIFKLNSNLTYETIDTKLAKITIIENFYENIDAVLGELEKLPMTLTYDKSDNNLIFFDARKCYKETMKGTEIPYTSHLIELVSKIIEYPKELIDIPENIMINCFKFSENFEHTLNKCYYSIHRDSYKNNQRGQVAIVIFLNKEYQNGEGLNFYMPFDVGKLSKNDLCNKSDVEINHFVQGKYNRAVLFDSDLLHGQHTPTQQFKDEIRYTQVIFCPIY